MAERDKTHSPFRPGGFGAGRQLLVLPAQRQLILEEQTEPFGMIEAADFGFVLARDRRDNVDPLTRCPRAYLCRQQRLACR